MSKTPQAAIDTSMDKLNLILKEIEEAYGWPKERRAQSYAALRSVLHVLRDRLPVQESAEFAAQLPLIVRGLYYEGWDPAAVPMKMGREEFLDRVRQDFRRDLPGGAELLVQTTLQALHRHVTEGEWQDVKSDMPTELAAIIP
ncbi:MULTISPECIES: DUF2267 domain-containing protein [Polymorphospora]|uniref:DUF2267 domain-containing protein n=1 Tax=Polymorphospora lycopeni TaxID=3140240 RepID=A0ABV5CMK0_9ACTN